MLGSFFEHGTHGVELFFVLSGFCLSYPALRRLRSHGLSPFDVSRYAAHRIVRIVPPFWIAIAAFTIASVVWLAHGWPFPRFMNENGFNALDVVKQALFLDGGTRLLAAPFWSLPVEFRWYFVFPPLLWLWVKSPKAFAAVGLAAAALAITRGDSLDAFCLPAFMLGIIAAEIRIRGLRIGATATVAFLLVTAIAVLTARPVPGADGFYEYSSPLWYLSAFALVVAAGAVPRLETLLSGRGLAFIGLTSYSIYLIHAPVIGWLEMHGVAFVVAAAIAVAAGIAFWFLAERPFVSGPLRERLVSEFHQTFSKWTPRVGLPTHFSLIAEAEQTARKNRAGAA
jgi:peptidoglycan/LPS O-acetylase OafA/YrhL